MKIEQLTQVIEIVRCGSLNRAAQDLYLSQPTLSLSLKSLETELGIRIFERGPKGMALTEVGRQLVAVVEPLCSQLAMVPALFAGRAGPAETSFSVSNAYLKFVINVYAEMVNLYAEQGLQSTYREANGGDVLEDVAARQADVGVLFIVGDTKSFMLKLFEYRGVTYHKLLDDGYWIILGPGNPLYYEEREFVTLEDIAPYPLVLYEEKHRASHNEHTAERAVSHRSVIRVNNRASMIDLIGASDAVNIGAMSQMPYRYTPFYPNLKTIELRGIPHSQEVGWICRRDYRPGEAARYFLTRLVEITTGEKPDCLPTDPDG